MAGTRKTYVFFRNDDVNRMEPGLVEMTQVLAAQGATVAHAVEPANLAPDVRDWLLDSQRIGVEIIQHGYAHVRHDLGEFGGNRPEAAQRADLEAGLRLMHDAFGDAFLPVMSFPFGHYNAHTIQLLDELGYTVLSSHVRHQFKRRVFYILGRALGRGRWLGRHVSHHLDFYPGSRLLEISVSISPIRKYLHDAEGTACEFYSNQELRRIFRTCRRQSPVVGVVLHHRFHDTPERLAVLSEFVAMLRAEPEVEFTTLTSIRRSRTCSC
jgi:peptidoglycan/xylan/chitin deacetylase (PgdA/CDA1 family)